MNSKASESKALTSNLKQLGSTLLSIFNKINFIGKYYKLSEYKKRKVHPESKVTKNNTEKRSSLKNRNYGS